MVQKPPTLEELRAMPALLGIDEAAAALRMSRNSAYRLVKCGEFPVPVMRLGLKYKVRTSDLVRYVAGDPDAAA